MGVLRSRTISETVQWSEWIDVRLNLKNKLEAPDQSLAEATCNPRPSQINYVCTVCVFSNSGAPRFIIKAVSKLEHPSALPIQDPNILQKFSLDNMNK